MFVHISYPHLMGREVQMGKITIYVLLARWMPDDGSSYS